MTATPHLSSLAIHWHGDHLMLLDQRALPHQVSWVHLSDAEQTAAAIRDMVVRGAPAIGITAAYGVALAAHQLQANCSATTLQPALAVLAASRPTAVNLFWAIRRCEKLCEQFTGLALVQALQQEAMQIHQEDLQMNRQLAAHGCELLDSLPTSRPIRRFYTHCNTGALATGGHGTALGIIRTAWERRTLEQVYAGETRPWLQGARLTAWELQEDFIPVTLVTDSAAGYLMQKGDIDVVIVGADRISANGDTANKIGTYSLAVLAQAHRIPFLVAAPSSTIDMQCPHGSQIDIEQRDRTEITRFNNQPVAPDNIDVCNPAFDVTPAELITAIITERGAITAPTTERLHQHMQES